MRSGLALLFFSALVLVTSIARADTTSEALALKTFDEGRRLFEAKDWDGAQRKFQASHDAMPSPNSRLYLARCLREKGQIASAYATFRIASREAEDRVRATGDTRYAATQRSAAFEAERLEPLVPRLTIRLEPAARASLRDAERAKVEIDGAAISRAQLGGPMEIDPGTHVVVVSGVHVKRSETRITLAQKDVKAISLTVERAPFGTVHLKFKTRPVGLAAEIDGDPLDVSDSAPARDVAVGRHMVTAHAPGYRSARWDVDVADDATADVVVDLAAETIAEATSADRTKRDVVRGGTPKWLFFATAGAAVVAAGTGTFLVAGARAENDSERAKPIHDRDPAIRDGVQNQARIGTALLVAAGGLGIGAGVLAFTTRWKVTPELAGLSIRGDL